MGVKCTDGKDCGNGLQCRNKVCNNPPQMAVAAVAITGVASLICGLALGYLITYCRMRKQLRDQNHPATQFKSHQEGNAYKNRSSINQDLKGDNNSTVDEGDEDDRNGGRGQRLLKY